MRQLIAGLWLAVAGCGIAMAEDVPLPRPRPAIVHSAGPPSFAEAAGPHFDSAAVTDKATDCDQRLAAVAAFTPMPRLIGPGACGGDDLVELAAVSLPDKTRVAIQPPALLRCAMAESLCRLAARGGRPACRKARPASSSRSRITIPTNAAAATACPAPRFREHAHGNAIDVRAFHLRRRPPPGTYRRARRQADARGLHDTACHRFTTVLGPGDPQSREPHPSRSRSRAAAATASAIGTCASRRRRGRRGRRQFRGFRRRRRLEAAMQAAGNAQFG